MLKDYGLHVVEWDGTFLPLFVVSIEKLNFGNSFNPGVKATIANEKLG